MAEGAQVRVNVRVPNVDCNFLPSAVRAIEARRRKLGTNNHRRDHIVSAVIVSIDCTRAEPGLSSVTVTYVDFAFRKHRMRYSLLAASLAISVGFHQRAYKSSNVLPLVAV